MSTWQQLTPLRPGDRVAVVAPGGALPSRTDLEAGLAAVRAMGLEPTHGAEVFAREGYFAGSDAVRARALNAALNDAGVRAIWAARGGYGSARLLPGLDADAVARAGKWLIGFSDISALHCLWARAALPAVHAVTVNKLATWQPAALAALKGCLLERRGLTLQGTGAVGAETPVRGRLFGGNLTVLGSLAGTGYLPRWDGGIVFFEDVGEAPYRLHRVATQLMQAGALQGAAAVVIGQLTDCPKLTPEQPGPAYAEVARGLAEVFAPLSVPVMWGLPVGHDAASWPLPLGVSATLDVAARTLVMDAVA